MNGFHCGNSTHAFSILGTSLPLPTSLLFKQCLVGFIILSVLSSFVYMKKLNSGWAYWYIPVMPAIQEAEIGRIVLGGQPEQ
jgi:hypothetical protein